jgi:hypothetical protein
LFYDEIIVLTPQDCMMLSDSVFRYAFIMILNDLIGDFGRHTLARDLPFIERPLGEIETTELRQLALKYQCWFNPQHDA